MVIDVISSQSFDVLLQSTDDGWSDSPFEIPNGVCRFSMQNVVLRDVEPRFDNSIGEAVLAFWQGNRRPQRQEAEVAHVELPCEFGTEVCIGKSIILEPHLREHVLQMR